jgi:hypothetical protein
MQIQDIVSKVHFLTKSNSDDFLAADMLILINNAYERVASLILSVDNRWQWDDSNHTTDFPIATTDLVANQADYTLATTHLKILRVECAVDAALSKWIKLEHFDQTDTEESLTQLAETTGIPYRFDELGQSVILGPAPDFSATAGLKVYFQRGPDNFTSAQVTTGTKQPGFNPLYHDLIPLWVSYEYLYSNALPTANNILAEINRKEDALKKDYASRNRGDRHIISMEPITFL